MFIHALYFLFILSHHVGEATGIYSPAPTYSEHLAMTMGRDGAQRGSGERYSGVLTPTMASTAASPTPSGLYYS